MGVTTLKIPYGNTEIIIEHGRLAKQAASVLVSMGDTMVLCTCAGTNYDRPMDFLPLTVEYTEKMYAAGKIPGGYFKREGRPGPWEVLNARMIDRPMRPLFPKTWRKEIQLICTVLSYDKENDPGVCAMVGAATAAHLSSTPFDGPVAMCRVALVGDEYVVNPTMTQRATAALELVVAGTKDAVTMVEGLAQEVSEAEMIDAIIVAHEALQPVLDGMVKLRKKAGKTKQEVPTVTTDVELYTQVMELALDPLADALCIGEKLARYEAISRVKAGVVAQLIEADPDLEPRTKEIKKYIGKIQTDIVRTQVTEEGIRIDGRGTRDVRAIKCELDLLPRTHGSALFQRGETQALAALTLGTRRDEQRIDDLNGDTFVPFMLHYNFPPFCVGEAKPLRGTSRREIGHGTLAFRGVKPTLPEHDDFSYTIRLCSEVLESNGSSSMATVCASSMALMAGGVPVKKAVAGIAMGLIQEGDKIAILSDILGDEDHLGDMDFKVVGTADGITALQMDMKVKGLGREILEDALEQANEGRMHILAEMAKAIEAPRTEMSAHSPRIITTFVNPNKIRDIIGPGGKTIRGITEQTGCSIDIDDTGKVVVASPDMEAAQAALRIIESLTEEPEVGRIYEGIVKKVLEFGAFVEILPGTDGLVHISELADHRVNRVEDILNEGDEVMVKCIGVDRNGKIRLSRREALQEGEE